MEIEITVRILTDDILKVEPEWNHACRVTLKNPTSELVIPNETAIALCHRLLILKSIKEQNEHTPKS